MRKKYDSLDGDPSIKIGMKVMLKGTIISLESSNYAKVEIDDGFHNTVTLLCHRARLQKVKKTKL